MGRRVFHKHAVIGRTVSFHRYIYEGAEPGSGYWSGDSLCGEGSGSLSGAPEDDGLAAFVAAHNRSATCPKCAKLYGKAKLAKLGGRVQIERREATNEERETRGYRVDSDYQPFRSWWRVLIDGVERASIVNERGFGTLWEIRQLKRDARSYGWTGRIVGSSTARYGRNRNEGESEGVAPIHRASLESAASVCLALYEAGLLPTIAEMEEAERLAAERRRVQEAEREESRRLAAAEREKREAERAERIEEAREALASLALRPDLTNLEAAGIASAKRLLGL